MVAVGRVLSWCQDVTPQKTRFGKFQMSNCKRLFTPKEIEVDYYGDNF